MSTGTAHELQDLNTIFQDHLRQAVRPALEYLTGVDRHADYHIIHVDIPHLVVAMLDTVRHRGSLAEWPKPSAALYRLVDRFVRSQDCFRTRNPLPEEIPTAAVDHRVSARFSKAPEIMSSSMEFQKFRDFILFDAFDATPMVGKNYSLRPRYYSPCEADPLLMAVRTVRYSTDCGWLRYDLLKESFVGAVPTQFAQLSKFELHSGVGLVRGVEITITATITLPYFDDAYLERVIRTRVTILAGYPPKTVDFTAATTIASLTTPIQLDERLVQQLPDNSHKHKVTVQPAPSTCDTPAPSIRSTSESSELPNFTNRFALLDGCHDMDCWWSNLSERSFSRASDKTHSTWECIRRKENRSQSQPELPSKMAMSRECPAPLVGGDPLKAECFGALPAEYAHAVAFDENEDPRDIQEMRNQLMGFF